MMIVYSICYDGVTICFNAQISFSLSFQLCETRSRQQESKYSLQMTIPYTTQHTYRERERERSFRTIRRCSQHKLGSTTLLVAPAGAAADDDYER